MIKLPVSKKRNVYIYVIIMEHICVSLSAKNTLPSLIDGKNCKISLGILMQTLANS